MPHIEICVDNLESVLTVNQFPVDRIELCAALSVGGITPSYGLVKQALALSHIPLAMMIRPRAGDFLFSPEEVDLMLADIDFARSVGIKHIVIGALTPQAEIDLPTTQRLIAAAPGMEITFHRAFDLCADPLVALEQLIDLGCHRILTSGQASTADQGTDLLKTLVEKARGRIDIMAGCGIHAGNVAQIVKQTGVPQVHFSAKGQRKSLMESASSATMGAGNAEQDSLIEVTDGEKVRAILKALGQ
ncbi:copper homeostasis protein CutC [Pasteurellaceae bacterium RH1A]|nr:copper homeostasis protein CutC [Pasteurellaceae bacterium RH1A]